MPHWPVGFFGISAAIFTQKFFGVFVVHTKLKGQSGCAAQVRRHFVSVPSLRHSFFGAHCVGSQTGGPLGAGVVVDEHAAAEASAHAAAAMSDGRR